ncbi:putative tricarboxylic transport membrane protein [Tindallia magadiensis]|uniref:Putative tricarboxylic transport membrane protein n=1 Tax=Tindallia magadiensis TaxID=69895 RepID=A0A1I3EVS8_9FIRM|nr:tripartite tricarboxylate transporter permease [Tindallia magadiensis]SFI03000.1 putative tricarboxylic transport membrane protein [Tindallia magadiensis]
MIEWSAFLGGASQLMSFEIAMIITFGVFFGIIAGAIPGFSSAMAIAILLPVTYTMDALTAMVFLASNYAGSTYGGSIAAILLNAPGTPGAVATAFDGYEMTKQGKSSEALGLAIGSSVVGGVISYALLLVAMYPIAGFAIRFGAPEMFLLAVLGLTIIASMKQGSFAKAILAGLFGVLISAVGISPTGAVRATFGFTNLLDGVSQMPAIIGFLAFTELYSMINKEYVTSGSEKVERSYKEMLLGTVKCLKSPINLLRSSGIGTFIGAVPAAGATIASFISYNQAKLSSKEPDSFGKGNPDGVIAAESSNNASTGGAMITMLALGIPGGGTTAMMLGALMLHGLQPGPRLFMNQMEFVYAIIIALFLSQIVMYIGGIFFSYTLTGVLNVSTKILTPSIAILCIVGSFALSNSMFDARIMFVFGFLGWIMKKYDYPAIAVVLGIVLGPMADAHFIRTAIRYGGDYTVFFTRPISLALLISIVILSIAPLVMKKIREAKNQSFEKGA